MIRVKHMVTRICLKNIGLKAVYIWRIRVVCILGRGLSYNMGQLLLGPVLLAVTAKFAKERI